jgi:E3 SUMO-protein ligase PIAS1
MPGGATVQNASAVPHTNYSATTSSNPNGYHPVAASSSIGRYDAYAPPRRPIASTSVAIPTAQRSGIGFFISPFLIPILMNCIGIRFKPSPFLRVDQAVSVVMECPGLFVIFFPYYIFL